MSADRLRRWVPIWWNGEAGGVGSIVSALTLPFEGAFRLAGGLRGRLYDRGLLPVRRSGVPVISIGNLTVGGTGKTPISAWVAGKLRECGRQPWILLRGYGMDEVQVHRELNPEVPIRAGKDRVAGAADAIEVGADCLILDDGFQHRRLHRDLDIVLVAAEQWERSPRLLPRGPWRESPAALDRASLVVVTRKSASRGTAETVVAEINHRTPARPIAMAHLTLASLEPLDPTDSAGKPLAQGENVVALSTLGNPEAFETQLRDVADVVGSIRFPDHHVFSASDVARIQSLAAGARIVVTRKEAVKLRGLLPAGSGALVANQGVVFEAGEADLLRALREAVN